MENSINKIGTVIRQSLPLEKKPLLTAEQIEKLKTAGGIALGIIGVAGIIALSAVAPNMFYAFDKLFSKKYRGHKFTRKEKERKIAKTFYYLKESGYIRMRPSGKDFKIFLTKLGKGKLKKMNLETLIVKKPSSWDGKWWQVAADIPTEEYKWAADLFRQKLKDMNFFPLQRTLWIYPYDPREEIEFIIRYYGIESFVTVMEINRLVRDDERKIKVFFREEGVI